MVQTIHAINTLLPGSYLFHLLKIFRIRNNDKYSMTDISVNGVCDELQSLGVEGRPVSLFQCQVFNCQTIIDTKYPYFTSGLDYR